MKTKPSQTFLNFTEVQVGHGRAAPSVKRTSWISTRPSRRVDHYYIAGIFKFHSMRAKIAIFSRSRVGVKRRAPSFGRP